MALSTCGLGSHVQLYALAEKLPQASETNMMVIHRRAGSFVQSNPMLKSGGTNGGQGSKVGCGFWRGFGKFLWFMDVPNLPS